MPRFKTKDVTSVRYGVFYVVCGAGGKELRVYPEEVEVFLAFGIGSFTTVGHFLIEVFQFVKVLLCAEHVHAAIPVIGEPLYKYFPAVASSVFFIEGLDIEKVLACFFAPPQTRMGAWQSRPCSLSMVC